MDARTWMVWQLHLGYASYVCGVNLLFSARWEAIAFIMVGVLFFISAWPEVVLPAKLKVGVVGYFVTNIFAALTVFINGFLWAVALAITYFSWLLFVWKKLTN